MQKSIPNALENSNLKLPFKNAKSRLLAIAEIAPRAAILESWLQIETAAVHLIVKSSGKEGYPLEGPTNLLLELQKLNVMDYKQLNICQTLRYLRNKAVHIQDEDFTKEATVQYIESALSIASFLEEKTN